MKFTKTEKVAWLLEVVDEYGNSNLWESLFATDRQALDQALKTIDEKGIESLISWPAELQQGRTE